jgi:hypothetical protein
VRYELGFYIPEDGIVHSHRRENLKSYNSFRLTYTWRVPVLEDKLKRLSREAEMERENFLRYDYSTPSLEENAKTVTRKS